MPSGVVCPCWLGDSCGGGVSSRFSDLQLLSNLRVNVVSNDERGADFTDLLRIGMAVGGVPSCPITCFRGAKFNCHVNRFCLARFERLG